MSASTSIVLVAGGISFTNEWLSNNQVNFRIPVATLGVAVLLDGIDKFSPQAANGLATIMLITILFTPFGGKTPAQTVAGLFPVKGN